MEAPSGGVSVVAAATGREVNVQVHVPSVKYVTGWVLVPWRGRGMSGGARKGRQVAEAVVPVVSTRLHCDAQLVAQRRKIKAWTVHRQLSRGR
ncbi:hypothetical protein E2C01_010511 [Portunus trituberculatus]|uniref:Uncharacterized protein n=1 Tax=Portunus trituberculatus TaxID=210409 RepID=A0A5B7D8U4_PORTR|nr:hypothetical protein [Portunus trituberculatus]